MSHIKAIQNPHISHRLSHTIPILGPCMSHINSFGKGFQKQALGLVLDFSQPSSKGYIFRGVITKFKPCTHTPQYIYILSRGAYYTCRGHLWGPYIQEGLFQNCKGLQ